MKLLAPRLSGATIRALSRAALTPVGSRAAYQVFQADFGVGGLTRIPTNFRGPILEGLMAKAAAPPRAWTDSRLPPPSNDGWAPTSEGYQKAYRDKRSTPTEVTARALGKARELAHGSPFLGPLHEVGETEAFLAAEASEERHRKGKPLGPFDGVPIVIKEEIAVRGFARQLGTSYLDPQPQAADGTLVAKLRAAGAIILGTTPMTELGLSPFGANVWRRMPRNPHRPSHGAGGSSTGSGVAVATGLVPMAIGCDGGGSIRIPAALVGVFGLKPTWGRVSRTGQVAAGTVEHFGPIAGSTLDLARALDIIAGADERDSATDDAPPLAKGSLTKALGRGVRGVRIGILDREWRDTDAAVARACRLAVDALEREGAQVVHLSSPLLEHAPAIGFLALPVGARLFVEEHFRTTPSDFGPDVTLTLSALTHVHALDYLVAMELRAGLRQEMQRLLREVDVIVSPTTASTAPAISDAEHESGLIDATATKALVRHTFLGNLTGLPAASVPVGKDPKGLPIGFQITGDAWDEASVLAVAAHLERIGVARAERPTYAVDVLAP